MKRYRVWDGEKFMEYLITPANEVKERVIKLQKELGKAGLDGVLLTNNVDIYYYSGTMQNSILYIPVENDPVLFVKKSIDRAKTETPFFVKELTSFKKLPTQILETGSKINKLGLDLDILPYNLYKRIESVFLDTSFTDISFLVRMQRSIKSNYEIELLNKSAGAVYDAMMEVPNLLRLGISELELSTQLEKIVRDRGSIGYIRTRTYNMELVLGMVTSGKAAATPTSFDGPTGGLGLSTAMPQSASFKLIEKNDPIIIDISAAINGYIIDQTRMAVIGQLDEELELAYKLSLTILREIEKTAKPGTLWSEHYIRALEIVDNAGMSDYFMGFKENQAKFLGHGVGLELDELPVLAKGLDYPLQEGMVLAVEPKFTFPNKGVIGIENTYVVTKNGLKSLSYSSEDIIYI